LPESDLFALVLRFHATILDSAGSVSEAIFHQLTVADAAKTHCLIDLPYLQF